MANSRPVTAEESSVTGDRVRVGVIGTGALGKEHVRIYAQLAAARQVELAGVYDAAPESARKMAEKYRIRSFPSLEELADKTDALSIVTPTTTHFELAKPLLGKRKH